MESIHFVMWEKTKQKHLHSDGRFLLSFIAFWKSMKNMEDFHWGSEGWECGPEEKDQANPRADKILKSEHSQKQDLNLKSSLNILVEVTKMNFR